MFSTFLLSHINVYTPSITMSCLTVRVQNEGAGYTDLGAAYISESHKHLMDLLARCDLKTCPVYSDGDSLCYRNVIRNSLTFRGFITSLINCST